MVVALEKELETYTRELPRLLAEGKQGKYVLIRGEEVGGVFATRDAGLDAGYDRYGLRPFLVKEITERETPLYFSRNVNRCP